MALVIETGAGLPSAEAYSDVASCSAWATSYYGHALTGSTADKEAAIRRAVAYLDGLQWTGTRTTGRVQALAWPRTGVTDCEGNAIGANEIPQEVIFAQHVLARVEFQSPGILSPTLSLGAVVRRNKVDVIEQEFDTSRMSGTIAELRPVITMAIDRLSCLLAVKPGGPRIPWAVVV